MKIKKFNVVVTGLAVAILAGACWFAGPNLLGNNASSESTVVSKVLAGDLKYSMEDKKIVELEWRSKKGTLPGESRIVKWEDGDRIYYQLSGPVNKDTLKATDFFDGKSHWGDSTEMEVFFKRTGKKYDQWLINPENAQILHFSDQYRFASSSDLPDSRYTCELKGDNLVTTFWVPKSDKPSNIVFNYNHGQEVNKDLGGAEKLSWVTTGNNDEDYDHHNFSRWREL